MAAGSFPRKEYPRYLLQSADYVVCCDSALQIMEKHGFVPSAVVGDMDSVCGRALRRFGGEVEKSPDQQTNDLTKAFQFLLRHYGISGTGPAPSDGGLSEIHILGATGRREDHTIANMSLLMSYRRELDAAGLEDVSIDMVSDYTMMIPLSSSCTLHLGAGRELSVFCEDPSQKIRTEGLQWPTDGVVFDAWWKASLNKTSEDVVSFHLSGSSPVLVVVE